MADDYIDNDYTITFYSASAGQRITSYPSSSVSQSVTTQTITQSVLNNYTWSSATGSTYSQWSIISGTAEIAEKNPNNSGNAMNYSDIGLRNYIRGDEIFTNSFRASTSEKNNGIVIYKSSSSGYILNDYINIPTASYTGNTVAKLANEFSIDGEHLIVPIEKHHSDGVGGELQIYKSSSSGWSLSTTLTTASYNSSAAVVADSDTYLAFWNAVVKNDLIFAGGFAKSYSSFPANGHSPDRYVAIFRSSSSGWSYEDQVQVSGFDADDEPGNNTETGGRIGNSGLNFVFDGTTGVLGSKHANGSLGQPLGDNGDDSSGRIHVIKSGSSGWYRDANLGLQGLGLTGAVDPSLTYPTASYDGSTYPDWFTFQRFGLTSCAVSGNYIAASARAKAIYAGATGKYHRRKDSVFLLKSASAGWAIEAHLEDPDPFFEKSGSYATEGDASFGIGLDFGQNSLMVASPTWRPDPTGRASLRSGRCYIYHSTSAGGWALGQTIENPYSGSVFHAYGEERNEYFSGPSNPDASGAAHFGALPALSGNILAIPGPEFNRHPDSSGVLEIGSGASAVNASLIYGGITILEGTGSFVNKTTEQQVTESVNKTVYLTRSGGPVPFRFSTKIIQNVRKQSASSSYKSFIGNEKT